MLEPIKKTERKEALGLERERRFVVYSAMSKKGQTGPLIKRHREKSHAKCTNVQLSNAYVRQISPFSLLSFNLYLDCKRFSST